MGDLGGLTDQDVALYRAVLAAPNAALPDVAVAMGTSADELDKSAARLAEIREQRARRLGGNNRRYTELVEIYDELEAAEAVHRRLGCPVIEISELSIEETAARVIRLLEQRRAESGAAAPA
jgi:hypothetical protein